MPSGQAIGGHAILFVGYDDSKSLFKFKNSWGTSWGHNGYGYLPYKYFTSGNVVEAWTVSQENFNGSLINIVVPSNKAVIFASRVNGVLTSGSNNTLIGSGTGNQLTIGQGNTMIGTAAGLLSTTGNFNTMVGNGAGFHITSGQYNVLIGNGACDIGTTASANVSV